MIIIEVAVPSAQSQIVEPVLGQCCEELHDKVLGRQEYHDVQECCYLVQLTGETHLFKHLTALSQAIRDKLITSFQIADCHIVELSSPDILAQMRTFPLAEGDSWIPAVSNPHATYMYMRRPLLVPMQKNWLYEHKEVVWSYV